MASLVTFSPNTQKIIKQLELESLKNPLLIIPDALKNVTEIDLITVVEWLRKEQVVAKEQRFLLASLYAEILQDLNNSLFSAKNNKLKKNLPGWGAKFKFLILAIAGTIYFGCEGFDGITAILGIFQIPHIAIFAVGVIFSVLSVIVFYAFDLAEISKNLGVKFKHVPQIIDLYLKEIEMIKSIRRGIDASFSNMGMEELNNNLAIVTMLKEKHLALDAERKNLIKARDKPLLKTAKFITAAITGIIFFSGGFFAGQTVALAIGALIGATLASTFWPVIVASVFVGLAYLAVYWYVERPGIENLIGRWFGFDPNKIDKICASEAVDKEQEQLGLLEEKLASKYGDLAKNADLEKEVAMLRQEKFHDMQPANDSETPRDITVAQPEETAKLRSPSLTENGFFKPANQSPKIDLTKGTVILRCAARDASSNLLSM